MSTQNAHSPENSSDEWAFFFLLYIKYTFAVTQIATKSWIKNFRGQRYKNEEDSEEL